MKYPMLEINLDRIQSNAAAVVERCSSHNIAVCGVVKGVCGSPKVAKAMLAGGVKQLGDSRISNLRRLRENGITCDLILLCIPMLSQVQSVVQYSSISLNSDLTVVRALGQEALKMGRVHKVILMIDLGDLREGVMPEDAPYIAEQIMSADGIYLEGIGTNLTCYGGVIPTEENMNLLAQVADKVEARTGHTLNIISGGNSSSLPMVFDGRMPPGINHLRIGEGILLGQDTIECRPLRGTVQNAFIFNAEVIEAGRKPSMPSGIIARDAFGRKPELKDKGMHRRAILATGRQDINIDGLRPLLPETEILGASSDHLLLDVEHCAEHVKAGDIISFKVEYSALLSAMTSEYVNKKFVMRKNEKKRDSVSLLSAPSSIGAASKGPELAPEFLLGAGIAERISAVGYECFPDADEAIQPLPFDGTLSFEDKVRIINGLNGRISEQVKRKLEKFSFPLVLGGDHTVTIGSLQGLRACGLKNIGLIVFGAFADFNTSESSLTKNLHGLTVSACAGIAAVKVSDTLVEQENVVMIGLRQLDGPERKLLKSSRVNIFSMEKIDLLGMREAVSHAIDLLKHCSDGIHVSLAMDVLSPEYAPGVSLAVPGGISYREAHLAMELLADSALPVSMDIVELNPLKDEEQKTVKAAIAFAASLLGKKII